MGLEFGRLPASNRGAEDEIETVIPRVLCPRCGTNMRLAEVDADHRGATILRFDCRCSFEYRMSARVYEHA